jgi:hypothetical protein
MLSDTGSIKKMLSDTALTDVNTDLISAMFSSVLSLSYFVGVRSMYSTCGVWISRGYSVYKLVPTLNLALACDQLQDRSSMYTRARKGTSPPHNTWFFFCGAGSRRNAISCHFRLHFPGSRIATSSSEGLQGFIPSCESVQLFPTPHFLSVNFV